MQIFRGPQVDRACELGLCLERPREVHDLDLIFNLGLTRLGVSHNILSMYKSSDRYVENITNVYA